MDASALDRVLDCHNAYGAQIAFPATETLDAAREELAALRARVEDLERSTSVWQMRDEDRRSRIAELERAINWALGCGHADDPFQARKDGQGAYYWRPGLAARAAMRYDSHAERYVHDLAKHYEARRALRGENEGKVST